MKKNNKIAVLSGAYTLLLAVMFLLPFFSVQEYSIICNTLSELGARCEPKAWIMNFIFISLALGSLTAGWGYFKGFLLHRILLALFGISLTLSAFFNHAPINPDIQYNIKEDGWNAYFTCTTELSFIILSIATSLIIEKQQDRVYALAAGISVFILSVLTSESEGAAGIWQRLIFIISFGWMIYNFKRQNTEEFYCIM
jgi:hypothetical membrane protein